MIQEINCEHLDEEIIHFDDKSGSESEVELEVDPIAQELINRYPYWSDREKEIKEIEVKKIMSTRSYQQVQECVRYIIIIELEIRFIQE